MCKNRVASEENLIMIQKHNIYGYCMAQHVNITANACLNCGLREENVEIKQGTWAAKVPKMFRKNKDRLFGRNQNTTMRSV